MVEELLTAKDHRVAVDAANRAGELLLGLRQQEEGANGSADVRAQELILQLLHDAFPDDPVLAEEAPSDPVRLTSRRVWIVDPLDGTREFGEAGRTDWAVHVALAIDGRPRAGAVALPARGMTLATDDVELAPSSPKRPRLVVSRTRPTPEVLRLAEVLDLELIPMGSAGAKAMSVVLGDADVYAHAGGQYEWDSAAPVAVAAAAGLHVSRLDGSALRYNQEDPWLPDVLICRPELAEMVLSAWAAIAADDQGDAPST